MRTLGISAYYHDSAAALLEDGVLVAAAQEERFSRLKHDARFPEQAVRFCIEQAGGPIDQVVYYERPTLKFERIVETWLATAPRGFARFKNALPLWAQQRLWMRQGLLSALRALGIEAPLQFAGHHQSHAASAFLPSPFETAAILTIDGVGEWETLTIGRGHGNQVELVSCQHFPHSLGLLYSAFTEYCGFRVNNGEYKLMGLAAMGSPTHLDTLRRSLIDLKPDGSFRLQLRYFDFLNGARMASPALHALLGRPPRTPESALDPFYADVAASIQALTEEVVARLAATAVHAAQSRNLCMAGGVALNVVSNSRLLERGVVDQLFVQPAAGDAGGALGAALVGQPCRIDMAGCGWGPALPTALPLDALVHALAQQQVIAVAQGAMEFGPRALGFRSILADPRSPGMKDRINASVKRREAFRPFAPAVLDAHASDWFDLDDPSPHMTRIARVRRPLPAVTHVDGTARVQTVSAANNPTFHALLTAFYDRTGCPVLLNTSFNVRGEPIVCTAADAHATFASTDIDGLAIDGTLHLKNGLPPAPDTR